MGLFKTKGKKIGKYKYKFPLSSKTIKLLAVFVILTAIPLTVVMSQYQQNTKQEASGGFRAGDCYVKYARFSNRGCGYDSDCSNGCTCIGARLGITNGKGGYCYKVATRQQKECYRNDDCGSGKKCSNGSCVNKVECNTAKDCGSSGWKCVNHECFSTSANSGTPDSGTPGNDSGCTSIGGTCKWTSSGCSGSFRSNLCLSNSSSSWKCCVPGSNEADSPTTNTTANNTPTSCSRCSDTYKYVQAKWIEGDSICDRNNIQGNTTSTVNCSCYSGNGKHPTLNTAFCEPTVVSEENNQTTCSRCSDTYKNCKAKWIEGDSICDRNNVVAGSTGYVRDTSCTAGTTTNATCY